MKIIIINLCKVPPINRLGYKIRVPLLLLFAISCLIINAQSLDLISTIQSTPSGKYKIRFDFTYDNAVAGNHNFSYTLPTQSNDGFSLTNPIAKAWGGFLNTIRGTDDRMGVNGTDLSLGPCNGDCAENGSVSFANSSTLNFYIFNDNAVNNCNACPVYFEVEFDISGSPYGSYTPDCITVNTQGGISNTICAGDGQPSPSLIVRQIRTPDGFDYKTYIGIPRGSDTQPFCISAGVPPNVFGYGSGDPFPLLYPVEVIEGDDPPEPLGDNPDLRCRFSNDRNRLECGGCDPFTDTGIAWYTGTVGTIAGVATGAVTGLVVLGYEVTLKSVAEATQGLPSSPPSKLLTAGAAAVTVAGLTQQAYINFGEWLCPNLNVNALVFQETENELEAMELDSMWNTQNKVVVLNNIPNNSKVNVKDQAKNEFINPEQIKIYPNPAQDLITVEVESIPGEEITFEVLDHLFRSTSINISNTAMDPLLKESIDISQLHVGMYFVNVRSSKGKLISKAFIKF